MRKKRKKRKTGINPFLADTRQRGRTPRELHRIVLALATFLLIIASVRYCSGQAMPPVIGAPGSNTTKSIMGVVLDAHGTPVPHAIVLLKDMKSLQIRSYIAKDDGSYHFYDLSGDINYQLRAEANGLTSAEKTVTVFNSHKIVKLNLKLNKKFKA